MSRWHPYKCRVCGIESSDAEPISAQGFCLEHGLERMKANNTQISECRGPFFDHWRTRCLAAFGVRLDEPQAGG